MAEDHEERKKRGRPRVESKRRHGLALVNLVRDFLLSRGQPTTEEKRLRGNVQVFGAPLSALVRHAKEAGLPCSRGAIYNLLSSKRRD